jgi:MFS family permease
LEEIRKSELRVERKSFRIFGWLKQTSPAERKTIKACLAGWSLDSFDSQAYGFVIPALIATMGVTTGQAGVLGTVALISSALGGWIAGILSDRYGRVRILQFTIVWFSIFSLLSGLAWSYESLLVFRALQGFGFGGEWTAGAVLLSEVMRPALRSRAMGMVQSGYAIGWALATIAFSVVFTVFEPQEAWRIMFFLGVLPCALIFLIRRGVQESEVFIGGAASTKRASVLAIFKRPLLGRTILSALMMTSIQGGYYSVGTWLITFLRTERQLNIINTSLYTMVVTIGAFLGYLTTGYLGDRIGRKKTLILVMLASAVLTSTFTVVPVNGSILMALGFLVGFFSMGGSGCVGAFLSELFPTSVRASGQGFAYNAGRGIGSLCPMIVGFYAAHATLGQAISTVTMFAYVIGIVALMFLPETRGNDLDKIS